MARLTRTQKYADLRNQLENGSEIEIKSEALNKYEDKLNELNINPVIVEEEKPVITEDVMTNDIVKEDIKEEVNDDYVPFDFDDLVSNNEEVDETVQEEVVEEASQDNDDFMPIDVEEVIEEATIEPIEEIKEEVKEEIKEEDNASDIIASQEEVIEETQEVLKPVDETVQEVISEPQVVEAKEENKVDDLALNIESLINNIDEEESVETENFVIDNQYLEDCLNEVNEYNKSKGLMTAEEVPTTILNEIRGTNNEEVKVEEEVQDELSNTVTLEIKKILSELDTEDEIQEEVHEVQAQSQEEVKSQEELPKEVSDMLKTYLSSIPEETNEEALGETVIINDVATIKDEAEKSLDADKVEKDDESTIDATLLNETMPLEVTSDNHVVNDNDDEDEEDEKGPNRILNFILITLIAVLILILVFIGYLILVAQGII